MTDSQKQCPQCGGKGTIPGTCVCDMEWRGNETDEGFDDCRCEQEVTCPTCNGKGVVD